MAAPGRGPAEVSPDGCRRRRRVRRNGCQRPVRRARDAPAGDASGETPDHNVRARRRSGRRDADIEHRLRAHVATDHAPKPRDAHRDSADAHNVDLVGPRPSRCTLRTPGHVNVHRARRGRARCTSRDPRLPAQRGDASVPPLALGELEERLVAALVALAPARRSSVPSSALASSSSARLRRSCRSAASRSSTLEDLVDEHERAVAGHLQEALALRVADDLGLRLVEPQLGRVEHRQQRLVVGEDADRAHAGARGDHLDLVVEDLALGGEDLDLEGRARH